jgi:excinuclease ABC subunit C
MKSQFLKKLNIPDKPGVYFFKKGRETLYIGKATSLRSRTRSYFAADLIATRGPTIVDMVFKSSNIAWQETDSVLEALLLEAELIKKYQPYYNVQEKDDKSFNCVVITREDFPKVLVVRKRELLGEMNSKNNLVKKKPARLNSRSGGYQAIYGPFTNGMQLREALKIIRRIFPFIDAQSAKKDNELFYHQLGLSPNTHSDDAKKVYEETIRNLKLFFSGKKKEVIRNMKGEMKHVAAEHQFEHAAAIRNRVFALEHINDISLLKADPTVSLEKKYFSPSSTFRIEAYDIAHMSGKNMVGVMTVVEDGEVAKHEYKKFIIRTQGSLARTVTRGGNDTGALEEVLARRFRHTEWGLPSLVVVDGSTAQLNVAKRVLDRYQFTIPIIAVIKDERHKARAIMGDESLIKTHKKSILLSNSEAHRFGIAFHKKKRGANFLK